VIVGSLNSLSAPSPQTLNGTSYTFSSWSDGGAQTHNITAPASATTYIASYTEQLVAPQNTTAPAISGSARVGRQLTADEGTWTGSQPMTFTYQWLRCSSTALASCSPVAGATSKTYTVTAADVGFRLRVSVTATNAAGSATATSAPTSSVRR